MKNNTIHVFNKRDPTVAWSCLSSGSSCLPQLLIGLDIDHMNVDHRKKPIGLIKGRTRHLTMYVSNVTSLDIQENTTRLKLDGRDQIVSENLVQRHNIDWDSWILPTWVHIINGEPKLRRSIYHNLKI